MRQPMLVMLLVAASWSPAMAQTPLQRCKGIADSLDRLRCYDALEAEPATAPAPESKPAGSEAAAPAKPPAEQATAAKPPAAPEDELITKAKAAVLGELRDPGSAQFQN